MEYSEEKFWTREKKEGKKAEPPEIKHGTFNFENTSLYHFNTCFHTLFLGKFDYSFSSPVVVSFPILSCYVTLTPLESILTNVLPNPLSGEIVEQVLWQTDAKFAK